MLTAAVVILSVIVGIALLLGGVIAFFSYLQSKGENPFR